ncbi:MAG TPA: uroporphyrinogen-III synthase [Candidatus Acidoferrales bacterium]|nr:uroporphyrinogen-III synthase [Candidatus Acidoferrales bacterium]
MPQKDDKPLAGKRVVVTRAAEQSAGVIAALEKQGAEVLLMPTIEFAPPEDCSALDAAMAHISDFDWILFTSQNAVRFFAKHLAQHSSIQGRFEQPAGLRTAAVGPGTAEAANKDGFRVDYVAKNHTGESLAGELAAKLRGKRVLLPRSDRADDRLPSALRAADAEVTQVIAYRTAAPRAIDPHTLQRVRNAEVDAILFASPSAFHNLQSWIPGAELAALSQRVQFATIGPTTGRAVRDAGAQVEIEAADASPAALADAIASYYRARAQGQPSIQPSAARRA